MSSEFAQFTSTDNQTVYIRKDSVAALEVVNSSVRVEGHIKVYTAGFKFLIQAEIGEVLQKLSEPQK